jgi:hypothetical protein
MTLDYLTLEVETRRRTEERLREARVERLTRRERGKHRADLTPDRSALRFFGSLSTLRLLG